MFNKILVPLDGSAFAERALPTAEALAASTGAELALVRAVPLVAPGEREPGIVSYLDERRIAEAQDYVTRMATALHIGRPVTAQAYLSDDIANGILARARDIGADVIVMTSHGESWPSVDPLGGTAARLTRQADCPLLVIGPHAIPRETAAPGEGTHA
jgi:nucleotide-binding universal stress UspA family protein